MSEETLRSTDANLVGRWIRYVHKDEDTGRESIKVTQIVAVHEIASRPQHHRSLDKASKEYVEFLLNQHDGVKLERVDFMTLDPEQVATEGEPYPLVTITYSALGKPDKIIEFSQATPKEVLTEIRRVVKAYPSAENTLINKYSLARREDNTLTFRQRNSA